MLHRLTLCLAAANADETEAVLRLAGATAVTFSDARDAPLYEPAVGTAPVWPQIELAAWFPGDLDSARLRRIARLLPGGANVRIESVPDAEWQSSLRQIVAPLEFGQRLRVIPADAPDSTDGRIDVRLHVGLGFGTGRHPTTALCLNWLDRNVTREAKVLDIGTGSGVLGIAALALGARFVWATDSDPQAIAAARRNAELNELDGRIWLGPTVMLPEIRPSLVVANILAETLIELEPLFSDYLRPGGQIVMSGILRSQARRVIAAFAPRFREFRSVNSGDWVRVAARRRP